MMGPYVSGVRQTGIAETTAMINPIQNVQRQPRAGLAKPLMTGAKSGPIPVACTEIEM